MIRKNSSIQIYFGTMAMALSLFLTSCKKFTEIGSPPTQVLTPDVFTSDITASSAIMGLYTGNVATQMLVPYTMYPGMSADDVQYNTPSSDYDGYENNTISINNNLNANAWYFAYQYLRNINYDIVGLSASTTLTESVKNQLLGEAKFLRAFVLFELVNIYGDVPMPLGNNDQENAFLPRTSAQEVWTQIIADLKEAQLLLPETYTGTFRARINKWAATTLLARCYLYNKDYSNAEAAAAKVIDSKAYGIVAPASAFVNNSNEIIWQIANTTGISTYGANYNSAANSLPNYSLYDTLYRSFETGDLRKTNWTSDTTASGVTYHRVTKYKIRSGTTGNEYNVALRFAELYLIRGEARAQQDKLALAKSDIDVLRNRAGLTGLSATLTKDELLLAIEQERKVELFGEWGHRWFDLKRTNRAAIVIGGQKKNTWKSTAVLYPVPDAQRLLNTSLSQNDGY
ncbi:MULTISPECIES: RagB/SusD family nutrient uptake outer membrane protein [Niastella]|uniref:RagB/SusD family nutrient uptake outer membrane protein n=1 Tax=Niastella soli TaxID=2821487 RepID=A0ABS3Z1Z8_9BACT|nr:RagB/SusD family nutrient uptake outer membrane protein [Niastella soli]MBO9204184.1 RagB/SusD family nutrient uptake outer membrane protein [Niastella soli]